MMDRLEKSMLVGDYCNSKLHGPFFNSNFELKLSKGHTDCVKTCKESNLVCGTDQFRFINNEDYLQENAGM